MSPHIAPLGPQARLPVPRLLILAEVMVEPESSIAPIAFPRFPDLPAELRLLVWHFALPRRVFEIRRETVPIKENGEPDTTADLDHDPWRIRSSDLAAVLLAPPVLLSVCREARKVASRHGSWKCVGSRPRGVCRVARLKTWFDPSTDTLCFDDSIVQPATGPVAELNGLVTEIGNNPAVTRAYFASSPASSVCVSLSALSGSTGRFLIDQWKRTRGFWFGVPRYLFYHDSIVMHLGRSSKVQQLFGRGVDRCHTLLIDIHDRQKLKQLTELYVEESDPAYFQRRVANWLEDITEPNEEYVEESYADLRNLWLVGQPDEAPNPALALSADKANIKVKPLVEPVAVLGAVQQFNHTHPWCRKIIEDMPDMQLVVHFRLCIMNHEKREGKCCRAADRR
ncbi:hypothetical protein GGS23DRAFT_535980 [Durotheca rogersii]|uniref:uncharacterized protein n=1 Tax=Durotheca rogersii TaxID=419775 RepID=UPI00221FD8A7|nr:uncharacterized protein GGS23DRAFT_535980 [Durotheca rogersii]KAI5863482.1 hypothetical protein GGS23DRAFT_535980 [Durotheca rogersii]